MLFLFLLPFPPFSFNQRFLLVPNKYQYDIVVLCFLEIGTMEISVIKTSQHSRLPCKAYESDAGFDLTAIEEVEIPAGERRLVSTELIINIPKTMLGRILPRSGLSLHSAIDISAGVLDSGFASNNLHKKISYI